MVGVAPSSGRRWAGGDLAAKTLKSSDRLSTAQTSAGNALVAEVQYGERRQLTDPPLRRPIASITRTDLDLLSIRSCIISAAHRFHVVATGPISSSISHLATTGGAESETLAAVILGVSNFRPKAREPHPT